MHCKETAGMRFSEQKEKNGKKKRHLEEKFLWKWQVLGKKISVYETVRWLVGYL